MLDEIARWLGVGAFAALMAFIIALETITSGDGYWQSLSAWKKVKHVSVIIFLLFTCGATIWALAIKRMPISFP